MTRWTGTSYGSVCRTVDLVVEFSCFAGDLQIPDLRGQSRQDDE